MAMAGRRRVFRVGGWNSVFLGSYASGSVLYCLHDANRSRRGALAHFFASSAESNILCRSGDVAGLLISGGGMASIDLALKKAEALENLRSPKR